MKGHARRTAAVLLCGFAVLSVLVWQAATAGGSPDPGARHLTHSAAILDTGVLVFREGLEAILVLAAVTASLVKQRTTFWRPVSVGAGGGFVATILTWFVVVAVLSSVQLPELDVQAGTGLLAIVVLLLVMNWFFHKIYWTGWISLHTQKKNRVVSQGTVTSAAYVALAVLGFSAVYREGFEVVLFLQSIRLQVGHTHGAHGDVHGSRAHTDGGLSHLPSPP